IFCRLYIWYEIIEVMMCRSYDEKLVINTRHNLLKHFHTSSTPIQIRYIQIPSPPPLPELNYLQKKFTTFIDTKKYQETTPKNLYQRRQNHLTTKKHQIPPAHYIFSS
ncbi:MAG: hypothetical protein DRP88_07760, partial [Candidatus Neomarinimicrobiota bacterium]